MNHTKNYHLSKVKHCRNFVEDPCSYDDRCWFIQDKKQKFSNPIFTCNHCDASFKTKRYLMRHKKQYHKVFSIVPTLIYLLCVKIVMENLNVKVI